jgi:hypothetical protein
MSQLQLLPTSLPDPDPFSLLQVVALHVSYQVSLVFKNFTTNFARPHSTLELLLATIVILELLPLLLVNLVVKHVPNQVAMQSNARVSYSPSFRVLL